MNVLLLPLPHSASGLTNDVTDPCQPADRCDDRKELFLSALVQKYESPAGTANNNESSPTMQLYLTYTGL